MKKLYIAPYLAAITLIFIITMARGQSNPNRGQQAQQGIDAASQVDTASLFNPQLGRRRNRLPGQQRGLNRPGLGDPQLGRKQNPNQARRQELRRRLMQAIGLTPEQHQRMQEIRRGHEDEAIAAGRRLRQARQSLDRAIMSEPYNDADVRQATEALAAAQGDKIRLESRIRAQVRGVLTPEQVMRFHQLERRMRREMREQNQQDREMGSQGLNIVTGPLKPVVAEEIDLLGLLLFQP
jgi:Spy/CpxP family protein refolding chaperone